MLSIKLLDPFRPLTVWSLSFLSSSTYERAIKNSNGPINLPNHWFYLFWPSYLFSNWTFISLFCLNFFSVLFKLFFKFFFQFFFNYFSNSFFILSQSHFRPDEGPFRIFCFSRNHYWFELLLGMNHMWEDFFPNDVIQYEISVFVLETDFI